MKPHQLKIEAFGPYADPVEIGFDELSQEGLFLIYGTTGAGKTFLLDALCFALYGEVSGDRSVKALKSDHAKPSAVPRVSLEFSCSGARYLVERSPAYTAPKTRGEGTTEKAPQASLYRLVGSEREVIVSRATEVTREVEGLVGLNAGQFRQVILLPQGKFAEVLRAKADEREALLKTLFDTVVFERAGYWLEDKAKSARGEVTEQNRAQEVLREQAAREWSPHAPSTEQGEAADDERETQACETVPTDQAGLDRLMELIAEVVVRTESTLQQTTKNWKAALKDQEKILKVADRWDRRTKAKVKLEALESKQNPIDDRKLQLATAVKAEALRNSVDAERSARTDLATLQDSIKLQLQTTISARHNAQALPDSVALLDLLDLPSLKDLNVAISDLASRRAEVSELAKKAQEATKARAKAEKATGLVNSAQADLSEKTTAKANEEKKKKKASVAYKEARAACDQLDGLKRAAREDKDRAKAADELPQAQKNVENATAKKGSRRNSSQQSESGA